MFFSESSKYLVEVLNLINDVQREDIIDKIIESVQKQQCKFCLERYMYQRKFSKTRLRKSYQLYSVNF